MSELWDKKMQLPIYLLPSFIPKKKTGFHSTEINIES